LFSGLILVRCSAQDLPGESYKYTAENIDLSKAQSDALNGLVQQIQSFVKAVLKHEKSEVNGTLRDSTASSVIAISSVKLTNVQEKVEKSSTGVYQVTKYISKAAVQEMFNQRKARILELLDVAQIELSNCRRIGSINLEIVFKDLYWANLLTSIHPYQITYSLKDETGEVLRNSSDVLEGIRYLFESISSKIQVVQMNRIEESNLVWKCRFEYSGIPISSLNFSFYDGVGQTIEYKAEDEMDELLQLAEEMTQAKFSAKAILLTLKAEGKKQPAVTDETVVPRRDTVGNGIPKPLQEVISQGTSMKTALEALRTMVKKRMIIVGRREDYDSLDGVYGLVLDESGIIALIIEHKGKWMDLIHSKTVETKELIGKKITWIDVLGKNKL
jgi:hypothetical protein